MGPCATAITAYAAAEGMDALVVGTGWPEFRVLDFERIKHLLKKPLIVDSQEPCWIPFDCAPWALSTWA